MICGLDAHSFHPPESFERLFRLVLLCQNLKIEAEVSLCVLTLVEKVFETGVHVLHELGRRSLVQVDGITAIVWIESVYYVVSLFHHVSWCFTLQSLLYIFGQFGRLKRPILYEIYQLIVTILSCKLIDSNSCFILKPLIQSGK